MRLSRPMRLATIAVAGVALAAIGTHAAGRQAPQTPRPPQFDVASIKRTAMTRDGAMAIMLGGLQGNRWNAQGVTLYMLIRSAYAPSFQMQGQILGGPTWAQSDRFDVTAKADGMPTLEETGLMLQQLLAERFKLTVHREKREMPVLALVPARSDGKLGRDLKPAGTDCKAFREKLKEGSGPPPELRPDGPPPPCSQTIMLSGLMMRLQSTGSTMAELASMLSQVSGRPVIDRTGLSGEFAFSMEFAREPGSGGPFGPAPPGAFGGPPGGAGGGLGQAVPAPAGGSPTTAATDLPSMFSAVQEQLGLKLESRREAAEVLVIDSAVPPTED